MCFSFPVPRTNPRLVPHVTFVMESWLLFLSPRLPRKDSLAISSRICLFRMAMILVFERMTKMSHFILASSLRPLQILLLTSFVLTASLLAWRASSGSFYWFSSLVLVVFWNFTLENRVSFGLSSATWTSRDLVYFCSPELGGPRPKRGILSRAGDTCARAMY